MWLREALYALCDRYDYATLAHLLDVTRCVVKIIVDYSNGILVMFIKQYATQLEREDSKAELL